MTCWRYLVFIAFTVTTNLAYGQESISKVNYKLNEEEMRKNPHLKYWIIDPSASQNKADSRDSTDEEVRIIVRLKTSPVTTNKSARAAREALINEEHRRFLNDISRLQGQNPAGRTGRSGPKRMKEYKRTLNGFAIVTRKDVVEQIKRLPDVLHVYEDKKAQAYDNYSNELINVPKVWNEIGATGKGITIGIIDTGVDYTHPELGGGIGPGFKVLGGYDFVNDDSDPLDDNGHGTHVAGIAAANGEQLKGAAPDAKLYAYKVLSSDGWGYDSDILAAIERTTDPDGDPMTDDALDVVNMSLGRWPDPEEPLSHAVNNAVLTGVTFVVAAGNNYNFQSIGTPGIAEQAITVGAVDQNRYTAYFSSKGPVNGSFSLKPDLAAPGVDIYSTYLNGQYSSQQGTSMSSPHVAGVVALLLEKHPTWTPSMIKASLMTTATSMQAHVWEQGAGVIDAFAAISNEILFSPGSISFGATDNNPEGFRKTDTLTVTNASNAAREFVLSLEGTIQNSAINVSFSESVFSLAPAETKTIIVDLEADPSLPILNLPDAYTGNIVLTSSHGLVRKSVITLVNPPITRLQFAGELPQVSIVIGVEGNYYWQPYYPTQPVLDLFLPAGKYDIISHYSFNRTVVSEGISSTSNTTVHLDKAMAKNAIIFAPRDKNGQPIPLPLSTGHGGAFFTGEGKNIVTVYFSAVDTLYINDQKDYGYDQKIFTKAVDGSDECYEIAVSTGFGIDRSMVLSNDQNFTRFELANPSISPSAQQDLTYFLRAAYFTTWHNNPLSVTNPIAIYRSQNDSSKFGGTSVKLVPKYGDSGLVWETGGWKMNSNNDVLFTDTFDKPLATIPGDFTYELGSSLLLFNAYTINTESRIGLTDFPAAGTFNRFYGERERGNVSFKLSSGGTILKSGLFNNRLTDDFQPTLSIDYAAAPGSYQLELSYEHYQVAGRFGQAIATLDFNTAGNDKNSPLLDYISLEANGVSTTEIATAEGAVIKFKAKDNWPDYATGTWIYPSGVAEVTVEIKEQNDESWFPLTPVQDATEEWITSLPAELPPGYYQLRLTARDNENNSFTYLLNPGFLVGPRSGTVPYATVILLEPVSNSINASVRPLFKWSAFEGATYNLQVSRTSDFASLVMNEFVALNEFQTQTDLKRDSTYYWRVKAMKADTSTPWSEIRSFEARSLDIPHLISPLNNALDVNGDHVVFRWQQAQGANQYNVEISTTEDFSSLIASVWLPDTTTSLDWHGFAPGTEYFWRVTAYYYTFGTIYPVASETFRFRTIHVQGPEAPQLITPHNGAKNVPFRQVAFNWKKSRDASYYVFELGNDSTFQSVTNSEWLPKKVTRVHVKNLQPGNTYYWRVMAYGDVYGASTASETFSFSTNSHKPPKLRFPENMKNEVKYEEITFEWERGESTGPLYLEVSETPDFSRPAHRISTDQDWHKITGLQPEKVYYWRIAEGTQEKGLNGLASEVFTFKTVSQGEPKSDLTIEAYPNPFHEKISIVIYSEKAQECRFTVFDHVGRPISSSLHRFTHGLNKIELSVDEQSTADLPDGIYLGMVQGSTGRATIKLILKRK